MEQKMVLVGDEQTGKTSLKLRVTNNTFSTEYQATIGADFSNKDYSDPPIRLQIWDTAGRERYASLGTTFYRGAHIVGIVLSAGTLDENLGTVRQYYDNVKAQAENARIYFIVNKTDLTAELTELSGEKKEIDLTSEKGKNKLKTKIAEKLPPGTEPIVLFCSAKNGQGVEQAFNCMVTETYELQAQIQPQEKNSPRYYASSNSPPPINLPGVNSQISLQTING